MFDIPLLLPNNQNDIDLMSLIKEHLKEETIDLSLQCQKCNKLNFKYKKKIKFSKLNDVIVFSLQRLNTVLSTKNNIHVTFTEYLNLYEFCDNDLNIPNTLYRLFGTINHNGEINFGHYYSYIRFGDIWYQFNDSFVNKQLNFNFRSSSVCGLLYEKVEI